jgi:hypothetical protein
MKNNQIKGIFTELVETLTRKSAFTTFIENEEISDVVTLENSEIGHTRKRVFAELQKLKSEYVDLVEDHNVKQIFARLARLETAIVQHRSVLATDVKLTLLNQKRGGSETSYVVARAPFYNPNNVKAEIRAYLGKAEDLGSDLVKLSNDPEFMRMAELELVSSMEELMVAQETIPTKDKVSVKIIQPVPVMSQQEKEDEEFLKQFEMTEEDKNRARKKRRHPLQPGPGPNPRPKTFGIYLPNTQKD